MDTFGTEKPCFATYQAVFKRLKISTKNIQNLNINTIRKIKRFSKTPA